MGACAKLINVDVNNLCGGKLQIADRGAMV